MERKEQILELLYNNTENWLSGEEISHQLEISRNAVLEHINLLRESGYNIESSSRLGHKLISHGDFFSEFEIKRNLKSFIFGANEIKIFKETDSTNIQAFKLASVGAAEGSIIIAESQTSGKGRLGRKWISPPGENLYLSIIVRPNIPTLTAQRLTLVSAVALSETLDSIGASEHRIKWPNDILFYGKKLSGILTEMNGDCDSIDFIIIGLGVNINSSPADYPDELKESLISLKEIIGHKIDRIEFLTLFLHYFEKSYSDFLEGRFPEILDIWIKKSAIINQKIKVTNHNEVYTGIVSAITPDGNLIVNTSEGIRQVNSGDINYL